MASEALKTDMPRRPGMHGVDLTTGSVLRHLVTFSVPMLLGTMFQTLYMIINALWIGNGLGADCMAAVTVSFPIFFVLLSMAAGLTLGSNVLVSQAYGAKDFVRIKNVVQNSLLLTGVVAVICVAVGFFGSGAIMRGMRTPPEVLPIAISYFRLLSLTIPFMFGVFFLASIMRGVGDSKTPLYFQAGSLVVAAILDPVLMFGWLGFPRMGLNGTAIATICAQGTAFVFLAMYIQWRGHIVAPDWRRLRIHGPTTMLTLKIGIPSMMQQTLVSLGFIAVVWLVNGFGTNSAAAYGIASRIDQLAFMPAMTIGMAVSTLAGQNIGARRYDRANEVFRWAVKISCGMTLIGTFVAMVFPRHIMSLFSRDADVVAIGTTYLQIVALGYLLAAIMFVSNGMANGAGHTFATTIFTFITFWLVRIPLAAYLSWAWGSVQGIWYAHVTGLAVGMLVSMSYYLSGLWKKPVIKRSAAPVLAPSEEME